MINMDKYYAIEKEFGLNGGTRIEDDLPPVNSPMAGPPFEYFKKQKVLFSSDNIKWQDTYGQEWIKNDEAKDKEISSLRAEKSEAMKVILGLRKELQTWKNKSVLEYYPDTEADGIVFCGKCGKQK